MQEVSAGVHTHVPNSQAEGTYHANWPMERLYNALTLAAKSSEASLALSQRMSEAVSAEERTLKELRAKDKKLRASHTAGVDTTHVLQGTALLEASLTASCACALLVQRHLSEKHALLVCACEQPMAGLVPWWQRIRM